MPPKGGSLESNPPGHPPATAGAETDLWPAQVPVLVGYRSVVVGEWCKQLLIVTECTYA